MKITKPANSENPKLIQKQLALAECDKCPCCGDIHLKSESYIYRKRHLVWTETWTVSEFRCYGCGCEFESDPYDFESTPIYSHEFPNKLVIIFLSIMMFISGLIILLVDFCVAGIVLVSLGAIVGIVGGIIIYLCRTSYKRHEFYDKFVPIEKHTLTSTDIDSILNHQYQDQDDSLNGPRIISL